MPRAVRRVRSMVKYQPVTSIEENNEGFYIPPQKQRKDYHGVYEAHTANYATFRYRQLELEQLIATWYFTQDVKHRLGRCRSSRAADGIAAEADALFGRVTSTLYKSLYDYLPIACFGEARHGAYRSTHMLHPLLSDSRAHAWGTSTYYDPDLFMPVLDELFNKRQWVGAYGGPKWGRCVRAWLAHHELNPVAWVDHVVDCAHNTGPVFNKGIIFNFYGQGWYEMLDRKQRGSLAFIKRKGCKKASLWSFPVEIVKLFERAKRHGMFSSAAYLPARKVDKLLLAYTPVVWGTGGAPSLVPTGMTEQMYCGGCGKTKCVCGLCLMCIPPIKSCKVHSTCEFCGTLSCEALHIWCEDCGLYDCDGSGHEDEEEDETDAEEVPLGESVVKEGSGPYAISYDDDPVLVSEQPGYEEEGEYAETEYDEEEDE